MSRTPTLPRRGLAALAALPLLPAAAMAQTGGQTGSQTAAPPAAAPGGDARPLRLVVPFPPGGALDLLARLLAERLGPVLARTVVVDNRAGAGGMLGADAVAKAAPDGATIGLLGLTTWTAMPFMFSRMPFDPAKDFTPLSLISAGSLLCVVNAETAARRGWSDFRALIAWAKANPDKVTMGSSGTGTSSHLCLAAVNKATGAGILHVPYRGGGPAIQDVLSGNIDMMFDVMPALMPHVTSGKLKALAVSSARPVDSAPGVPGMAEFADLGLGHVDIVTWNAIAAPAGLPDALAERLAQAVRQAGAEPEFRERLRPLGYEAVTSANRRELEDLIAQQRPIWRELVEISGARLD